MSAAKVRRMSPSSVAQDWVDRFGRGKGPETTFPFPNELPDHFPSPIFTSFNEKAIPLPTRDVRNSPVSTASNLSQSSEQNSSSKCRQLPCRTFVSTGSCPYGDRCVFLHDPLIVSKPVFIKIKRKSKEDAVTDAFFWPTMPQSQVMGKVDSRHQPDVSQSYTLPPPGLINEFNSINDAAVYSMWEHFVDYLVSDPLSVIAQPRSVPPLNPSQPYNRYSGKRRLPVFMALCVGKPLSPQSKPFTVSPSGRSVQCR